jgi:hypothetical protein
MFERAVNAYKPQDDTMLMYFLSQLDVRLKWLLAKTTFDQAQGELVEDVKSGLANLRNAEQTFTEDSAWTEVYRLERTLALVEPLENLLPEIGRRLDEAAGDGVAAEPRLRAALKTAEAAAIDNTKTPPELRLTAEPMLRTLLLDVLEEIHWTAQRKFYSRPIAKSATRKIVWAGLASFVVLVLPYVIIFGMIMWETPPALEQWPWVALYTALAAGLFGAFFSRLMYIQTYGALLSLTELKNAREFSSLFLRGAVGMCGALVVFFFLQSGIVDGSLFPNFDQVGFRQIDIPLVEPPEAGAAFAPVSALRLVLPTPALALLVIWCFIAGFSERLVPTVLSSTEARFSGAAQGGTK